MSNCVISFTTVASLKRKRVVTTSMFKPEAFLRLSQVRNFRPTYVLSRFNFRFTLCCCSIKSNFFVLLMFWGKLEPVQWCKGFPVVHGRQMDSLELTFFIMVGLYSPCPCFVNYKCSIVKIWQTIF